MKDLRNLLGAVVFTLVFALTTFAGQIDLPRTETPPPPPPSIAADGEIENPVAGDTQTTAPSSELVVETTLNLVRSMLALF